VGTTPSEINKLFEMYHEQLLIRFPDLFQRKTFTAVPFLSGEAMEKYAMRTKNSTNLFIGVVFDERWNNASEFPDTLNYTLRPPAAPRAIENAVSVSPVGWVTNLLFSPKHTASGPRDAYNTAGGKPGQVLKKTVAIVRLQFTCHCQQKQNGQHIFRLPDRGHYKYYNWQLSVFNGSILNCGQLGSPGRQNRKIGITSDCKS